MTAVKSVPGVEFLEEWAKGKKRIAERRSLAARLIVARSTIHPALDRSLYDILSEMLDLPRWSYDELLRAGDADRSIRLGVAYSLEMLQPMFRPEYVPFNRNNPYAFGTMGHAVWRALWFSVVRWQFSQDEFHTTLMVPEVSLYGEPLHRLQLHSSLAVPEGHEAIAAAYSEAEEFLAVGEHNKTARTLSPTWARPLAQSVGLAHCIWGDPLYLPPL